MNKFLSLTFSFFVLILLGCNVHAHVFDADGRKTIPAKPSINIFNINTSLDDNSGLISLSEIYPVNDETAVLSIPNMTEKGVFEAKQYTLNGSYRQRFLSQTGISEKDFIFIYDYANNKLATFAVKDIKVMAHLNVYAATSERPFYPSYYMIGFEVNQKMLSTFKDNLEYVLVYIGPKNPFAQEQLTPLVWQPIPSKRFPITTEIQDKKAFLHIEHYRNLSHGNTYLAEANGFQYYLQDYIQDNIITARRLMIVEPQAQEIIIDKTFHEGESVYLNHLNGITSPKKTYQWTGKLFKNKPPVFFGFTLEDSLRCPYLSVIDKSHEEIHIYCDNQRC